MFLVICSLLSGIVGCSGQTTFSVYEPKETEEIQEESITILCSLPDLEGGLCDLTARKMKEVLEEVSHGKMKMSIYSNNALGTIQGGERSLKEGTVELRISGTGSTVSRILCWMPSIVDMTPEEMDDRMEEGQPWRQMLNEEMEKESIIVLGVCKPRYRVFTSKTRVDSIDDFEGLHMRLLGSGVGSVYWENLGTEIITCDIQDLYLYLQQNVLDSQENTLENIVGYRLYEQQQYVVDTNHTFDLDFLMINRDFYQGLSEEERGWIDEAAAAALEYNREEADELYEEQRQELLASGCEEIILSSSEKQALREKQKNIVLQELGKSFGVKAVNEILRELNMEVPVE
ncbi:MAG: TRAP transporter substrate-binding protein [Clostridiales bacterium]|nr:TRAP transporter substrate-binding protein [Clostridiales bacterium]